MSNLLAVLLTERWHQLLCGRAVATRELISAGSWDSGSNPQKQFAPIGEDEYS